MATLDDGGGERDTSTNSSVEVSMTEFREVKSTADDLRVGLEVKSSKPSSTKIELTQTLKWGEVENKSGTSGL